MSCYKGSFNGDLFVAIDEQILVLRELSRNERFSNNFDNVVEKVEKTKYIPTMSHPWKINSFKKEMQTKTRIIFPLMFTFF